MRIAGKVIEKKSRQSIPFASIYFPGTYHGTISNQNGDFSITIPSNFAYNEIVVSCLGFKSDTIDISLATDPLIVSLDEHINQLDEVMIMSDNSIYKLLKKAYDKIHVNYPTSNTSYKGFYRETTSDSIYNYISFGEAFIETVRGSVNLRNDKGEVKIIKSRGGYLPGKDSVTDIRFYGGIFLGNTDFVQQRLDFIKPSQFANYKYVISKYSNCYKILFQDKRNKNGFSGYFLIDTLSMAYTEAKYKEHNTYNDLQYKKLEYEQFEKFIVFDGKYYLKYKNQNTSGLDKMTNHVIHHFDEYLTSDIYPSTQNTIPEIQQVNYSDIFIDLNPDFDENFWDGYNVIEGDSMLNVDHSIGTELAKDLKNNEKKKTSILKNIAPNLSINYGISYRRLMIKPGDYQIELSSTNQSFSSYHRNSALWSLTYDLGYYFKHNLSAYWSNSISFGNRINNSEYLLGIQYRKRINRFGSPYYCSLSTGFGFASTQVKMGSFANTDTFLWGKKELNCDDINVYSGVRSIIIKPQITFIRKLKGLNALYLSFAYNLSISKYETIVMSEANLLETSAFQRADKIKHICSYDGTLIHDMGISNSGFSISLGFNLSK